MQVLIRSRPQDDAPATERRLDLPRLTIGRGAEQDLVLNDLRIALAHAEIVPDRGVFGAVLRIEARAALPLWVNGRACSGASLGVGDEIGLGRYRLRVLKPPAGVDLALELEERQAAHDGRDEHRLVLRQTIAEAGWSRRRLAWGLFLLVLLAGLVAPMLLLRSPAESTPVNRDRPRQAEPGFDILWNSGPLARAHHALQNDCGACHRKPFEPAGDAACRDCHTPLAEHSASPAALAQPPFAQQACTDCHREHNGADGLVPRDNAVCTDCHAESVQGQGGVTLEAASDFSHSHPPFRVRLARRGADGQFLWPAVRQGSAEAQRQDSGLKFPHALHLAAKGIDAPGGTRQLACGDCHQPTADRSGFLPVRMEAHCSDCHRLDLDPDDPAQELPHGKPEQVVRIVRAHYAAQALTGRVAAPAEPAARRRPGAASVAPIGRTAAWAEARAEQALRDVFERRTCFSCHTVTRDGPPESPWRIAPVAPQRLAFAGAVFPHSAHETEGCGSCHAAQQSKQSEDVLLPDIARCRDCHGDTGALRETPSSCQSCHAYHTHPPSPAIPAQKP